MIYNELEPRGTADFPIEYYFIDKSHPRYEMAAHWHSELEIIKILDGELCIKLNDKIYTAKKDDIVFVNPETVHSAIPSDCTYECLVFHLEFLYVDTFSCRFFIESILNRECRIEEHIAENTSEIYESVTAVFGGMRQKSSGYKFKVIGALYNAFGIIVDRHLYSMSSEEAPIEDNRNIPKLKRVLKFIRDNHDKQITLENMAKAAGMSPKYFCYFFKEMTGRTPVSYLKNYRIEKAAQKLLNTDSSVTDIAYSCGFNDLSYFIKTFKDEKGISPTKFRKA